MAAKLRRHHLQLLLCYLLTVLPCAVTAISFKYTGFDHGRVVTSDAAASCSEGTRQLCLQESAAVDSDSTLLLTNRDMSRGYALYSEAVPLWTADGAGGENRLTNFTTIFSVNFTKSNNNCTKFEDGMAFFLSPYPHRTPPNSDNGMLGLVSRTNMFDASAGGGFVAVEIDTHTNEMWDPPFFHLGIDVNSIKSAAYENITSGNGSPDVVGEVRVEYSSATRNLTASLKKKLGGTGKFSYFTVTYNVDLSRVLPKLVAVGLSATTLYCTEYYRVVSWSFDSSWDRVVPPPRRHGPRKVVILTAVIIGAVAVVAGGVAFWVTARRRRLRRFAAVSVRSQGLEEGDVFEFGDALGPQKLRLDDLVAATDNFDERRKIGEGRSGAVYRGFVVALNREVAVKRVVSGARRDYAAELRVISQLRHRHLVQLLGWCHSRRRGGGEFLLVYELMPNLSLDRHLFGGASARLAWGLRYNIALGVASALLYLHEGGERCVLHRDVKSGNVMLDADFNAKLGDFGLARFTDHACGTHATEPGGTLGYMAPECMSVVGMVSAAADVYAFGVVALEIATGRRAVGAVRLVPWVWGLFGRDAVLEAADPSLDAGFDRAQMERLLVVGLWCAHPDAACRPSIGRAVAALNFENVRMEIPRQMPVAVYNASGTSNSNPNAVALPATSWEPHRAYSVSSDDLDPTASFVDISSPSIYFRGR